jgi:hypothetical protein
VEDAPLDDLRAVTGEGSLGGWGPRRFLVWLAERLAHFAAYFDNAERILLRLALAESEPHIGNNATRIWHQLFRVYLSGTEVPFPDRLVRLRQYLLSKDPAIIPLAFGALGEVFDPAPMRMEGRPVVAGRLVPPDWEPRSPTEHRACYQSAFALLCETAQHGDALLAETAREFLVQHLQHFLTNGWLDGLKNVFTTAAIPPDRLPVVSVAIERFLHFEDEREKNGKSSDGRQSYRERVRAWLVELSPRDLHQRLLRLVARDPWESAHFGGENAWNGEIAQLARELLNDPRQLANHLEWLCSPEARSAYVLGQALGRVDAEAVLFDLILDATGRKKSTGLGRGYLHGLLATVPNVAVAVNAHIDQLQAHDPALAYELFMTDIEKLHALPRLLHLVDAGALPPFYLRGFAYGVGERKLTRDELTSILERLAVKFHEVDWRNREAALEILAHQTFGLSDAQCRELFELDRLRELTLETLRSTLSEPGRYEAYTWFEVAKKLWGAGLVETLPLAAPALVSQNHQMREHAKDFLSAGAVNHAAEVMDAVGKLIMDDRDKYFFFIEKYDGLVSALPVSVVASWLDRAGLKGARRLARHLPSPFIDPEGQPRVPDVTAYVLRKFETDTRTFREFCAGVGTTDGYLVEGGKKRLRDAEIADRFLDHALRRIREWARMESRSARADAERQRMEEEEETLL